MKSALSIVVVVVSRYDLMPGNMRKRYEDIKGGKRAISNHYELPDRERSKLLVRGGLNRGGLLLSPKNSPKHGGGGGGAPLPASA